MPKTSDNKFPPRCEHCQWWRIGDPAGQIGNKGLCVWALHNRVPEGLKLLTVSKVSWEGGNSCAVYQQATKAQIKENTQRCRP